MKRLLGAVLLVTVLSGCAGVPLITTLEGSLSINGAIAAASGNYERQAASALINMASHKSTGKTVSEHLYAAVETGWTKNTMEKHFPNKKLTITDFKIANKSLKDLGILLPKNYFLASNNTVQTSRTFFEKTKVKWQGFNYRVYDSDQPNFFPH